MTIFVVDIWHAEIIIQSVAVITIKIIKSTCGCVQEMSENGGGGQLVVKARFNFKQNNEDELSFNKGELIHVTRQEEGGWWEGSFNGKTGWFPSNYVREVKPCGEWAIQDIVLHC